MLSVESVQEDKSKILKAKSERKVVFMVEYFYEVTICFFDGSKYWSTSSDRCTNVCSLRLPKVT